MAFTETNVLSKMKVMAWASDIGTANATDLGYVKNLLAYSVGLVRTIGSGSITSNAVSINLSEENVSPLYIMTATGAKTIIVAFGKTRTFAVYNNSSSGNVTVTCLGMVTPIVVLPGEVKFFLFIYGDPVSAVLHSEDFFPFGYSNSEVSIKESKGDELSLSWAPTGFVQDKNIEVTIPVFGAISNLFTDIDGYQYDMRKNYIYIVTIPEAALELDSEIDMLDHLGVWRIKNDEKLDIELLVQANQSSITTFMFKKSIAVNDNNTLRFITSSSAVDA